MYLLNNYQGKIWKLVGTSSFIQIQAKLAPYNVLALQVVNLLGTQVSFEWWFGGLGQ